MIRPIKELSKDIENDESFTSGLTYLLDNVGDLPSESYLSKYEPKEGWFLRNPKGLHGIGHSTRVLVLTDILTKLKKSKSNDAINWAAATHDTQRMRDDLDKEHGLRSSKWIYTLLGPDYENINTISYINRWHDEEDADIPEISKEIRIFKDADGLDRWRLVKPRLDLLRTKESLKIIDIAKYLQRLSYALKEESGLEEYSSVIEAGKRLGIIKN